MKHALNRTSPFGEKFVGTCYLCGKKDLLSDAVFEDCENVRDLTQEQALLEAIDPQDRPIEGE